MITLTSDFKLMKNKLTGEKDGPWVWCVDLWLDETTIESYTSDLIEVVFNGITYVPKGMTVKPIASDSAGTLRNYKVTISAVDRTLYAFLNQGKLLNKEADLLLVHRNLLISPLNFTRQRGLILSADGNEEFVTFTCGTYDLRSTSVPWSTFSRLRCRWRFSPPGSRNIFCAYPGATGVCDKTIQTCETLNNKLRFGGFPGTPIERP